VRHRPTYFAPLNLRSNAVAFDDATVVFARVAMGNSKRRARRLRGRRKGQSTVCSACARSLAAIAKLEKRIAALETEVTGPPAEELLESSNSFMAQSDARWAAIQEYARLQQEELYKNLPWAREADERRRAKYEAFMRERGFEP